MEKIILIKTAVMVEVCGITMAIVRRMLAVKHTLLTSDSGVMEDMEVLEQLEVRKENMFTNIEADY